VFVENLRETLNLGKKLSQKLKPKSIVLLQGPIGAGKTSLVQGIANGLSICDDITSPTFSLSHHYISGKIPLIHLDLYRLENMSSAKEIFFFFRRRRSITKPSYFSY
jgi:tRNA threonylcarbamoyladenosine biosynthesis protein TsaE